MRFSDLPRHGVVVWGLGREGRAVLRRCRELGLDPVVAVPEADPTAYDDDPAVRHGEAARRALLEAEVVVRSPGVPATSELHRTVARQARTTSLTDLWLADHRHRTVAVTGTKGKSTTAALVHHLLSHHGHHASLLGNIGTPLLEEPEPLAETAVVELSSYQAQSVTSSPRAVVLTSLFPEHVGWHGSVEQYFDDKLRLVDFGPELVVCPWRDERLVGLVRPRLGPRTRLVLTDPSGAHVDDRDELRGADGRVVPTADLPVQGAHNLQNVALAVRTVEELGLLEPVSGPASVDPAAALASFRALPHRMETVPSSDHRTWVDDGLATAPEAVVAALRSLPDQRIALVLGGADRGLDFAGLLAHLWERPAGGGGEVTLLLVGPAGARVGAMLDSSEDTGDRPVPDHRWFPSLADACAWAHGADNPAAVVLLSPGAPSFDEFEDYRARSALFRRLASS